MTFPLISLYQNNKFDNNRKIWNELSKSKIIFSIGLFIFFSAVLIYDEKENTFFQCLCLPFSFIIVWLEYISKSVCIYLNYLKIDYDSKIIESSFKKKNGQIELITFEFEEINVFSSRDRNVGLFLVIQDKKNSISIQLGDFGIQDGNFYKMKEEIEKIAFQNEAWWENMKETFPNIP